LRKPEHKVLRESLLIAFYSLIECFVVSLGFETRSLPALVRCYPRSFTFYLGNPFETRSVPTSLVATLAILPSISEISFLDSSVPEFLISFSRLFLL
jgi:hypothetical protein